MALVLVTATVLQTTLFAHLTIGGFRPDLLLLVVVGVALRDGAGSGVRVGFAAGLLADLLLNQSAVGLSAVILLGVGYTVGLARPYLAPESVTAPLILSFLGSLFATAGYGLLSRLLGDDRFSTALVIQATIYVTLFNTLLAPVVVGAVTRLSERFPVEAGALSR